MAKNTNKNRKKKKSKHILARLVFLLVLAVVIGVSFFWEEQINVALGLKTTSNTEYEGNKIDDVLEIGDGSGSSLIVHFVDVGQGDACVIELPDGKKMIIDGGKDKEKQKLLTYIDEKIDTDDKMEKAKQDGGYGFDYAILTHSDEDHCGGLDDVLELYAAKIFYRPNELSSYKGYADPGKTNLINGYTQKDSKAYMTVIEAGYDNSETVYISGDTRYENIYNSNIIKSEADENSNDYYEFVFYSPIKNSYKDYNDYSPIIILTYQGRRIALSGDAEKEAEGEFVTAAKEGNGKYAIFTDTFTVDVIKLGHHGSHTSSTQGYLDVMTRPDYTQNILAIVSCGAGNSYKHPRPETIERLLGMGIKQDNILRTDILSTIALKIKNGQILFGADVVISEKPAIELGNIQLTYREFAIAFYIFCVVILIVLPIINTYKKSTKPTKRSSGNKTGSRKR